MVYSILKNDYIHIEKITFEDASEFRENLENFGARGNFFYKFPKLLFIRLESSSLLHKQGKWLKFVCVAGFFLELIFSMVTVVVSLHVHRKCLSFLAVFTFR